MQVEIDYDKEVYDGDLGVVSGFDMEEGERVVDFEVTYGFGELDELVLARDDNPQEPRLGVPGRGHPADDATLPHAAA